MYELNLYATEWADDGKRLPLPNWQPLSLGAVMNSINGLEIKPQGGLWVEIEGLVYKGSVFLVVNEEDEWNGCGYLINKERTGSWHVSGSGQFPRPPPKRYALKEDLKPYVGPWGKELPLPNWKPVDLTQLCQMLAGMGGIDMYNSQPGLKVPENHYRTHYGRLFPTHGQGGGWDGCGYAIVDTGYGNTPAAGHWAICKHEKVDGPGANHQRGWHPGYCSKCGMDMTVDSGD